jgi:NAD(P)H-hydrate epimerase
MILTPHTGEAARLLAVKSEEIIADRKSAIKRIVERYNATVILKGPNTLVASPGIDEIYECDAGNPFMALGGMGDLLAGVIGARWAYLKGDPFVAAASSVWLHGAASDRLVENGGDPSIVNTAGVIGSLRVALDR